MKRRRKERQAEVREARVERGAPALLVSRQTNGGTRAVP